MKAKTLLAVLAAAIAAIASGGFSKEKFRNPENIHSPAYFWMWNAKLDPAMLNAQLDDMYAHGMQSICIHPFPVNFRPNGVFDTSMSPDYLTQDYFKVFSNVVEHAASLGMNVWLYDEGGWPSGGACGQIAAADREGRFKKRFLGYGNGKEPFALRARPYGSGSRNYPSIIEKGTTDDFIRRTHREYKKYIGHHFGKAVKFTFMDEPAMPQDHYGANLGWTADFDEEFKRRKGYDIAPFAKRILDSKHTFDAEIAKERIDYFDVMADLFVERFMKPIKDWDNANKLGSSGHLNGEDVPQWASRYGYGALLRSLRAMDVPGVDVIWRQLFPETDSHPCCKAPFPRYASSVAHQQGHMLAMTESFGIYGNAFTPDQMKWVVDYQLLRGINMFVFGYYNVSNAGQWMLLFEPHSGPVAPWWDMEKPYFEYIARTGQILADGRPAVDIAVYFDTRAFWAGGSETESAGAMHYAAAEALDRMNCEYEFVDDDALASAAIGNGRLKAGAMSYSTLVLPSSKWMRADAKAKLEEFKRGGGKVLTTDTLGEAKPVCRIKGRCAPWLRAAKRVNGGETLYFVVNETRHEARVTVDFDEKGDVVRADPLSGEFVAVERGEGGVVWDFPGYGSAIFIVGAKPDRPVPPEYSGETVQLNDGWTVRPLVSHSLGEDEFVISHMNEADKPARLGDWRGVFGNYFSGKALYTCRFSVSKARKALLDLGTVGWTCSVRLNGQELPAKFFGPFKWEVELKDGENVLEVTVANMLANAVADPVKRQKAAAKYPPNGTYDPRQRVWDRENHESGLIGPVRLTGRR